MSICKTSAFLHAGLLRAICATLRWMQKADPPRKCRVFVSMYLKKNFYNFQDSGETVRIVSDDKDYHTNCYICEVSD